MAEFTSLATRFWEDPYIQSLPPTDKLLYVYLISGPQSEPTLGIYELGLRTMAHHTGLTEANIGESLNRFAQAGKIHHVDGWIIVINHFKHNSVKSDRVLAGAHRRLKQVPWSISERLVEPTDTIYIPYLDPKHSDYIGYEPTLKADGRHTVPIQSEPVPSLSPSLPLPVPNPITRPGRSAPKGRPSEAASAAVGGLSEEDRADLDEAVARGDVIY